MTKTTRRIRTFKTISAAMPLCCLSLLAAAGRAADTRIKDMARIAGVEQTDLVGYGIVVGLEGTGDKDIELSKQTMANLLENFNITIPVDDIKSKNVAAVIVSASAPPFHKEGNRVDVNVSSIGDASSLQGGVLLMTPLLAPDGEVYALAQGNLTVGGFSAGTGEAGGPSVAKNFTTTGIIPNGATLKHSQSADFFKKGIIRVLLRHPDFTTADRMANAVNESLGPIAVAVDAATVAVRIPEEVLDTGQAAAFAAKLEKLSLTPDTPARIIVNERTGTVVMGGDVHISEAVVAHGNLTVTIRKNVIPSQPANLILGENAGPDIRSMLVTNTTVEVKEEQARVMVMPNTTTVRDLADTLNLMGATPRDLISILEALHRLGAIQMELISM